MAKEVWIAAACRTAIGKTGGSLAGIPAAELGAVVIRDAVRRAGIDAALVEQVYMGMVLQSGCG